jgi:CheY-like chemotaxis protein
MTAWLIVEDEPDIYEMMMHVTQILGIDGIAFVDGEEATDWIEDVDTGIYVGSLPEVAILDIRLPGKIDGPMVGERLRQSPKLKDIPIVLMTAYKLSVDQEAKVIEKSGSNLLLYKPLPKVGELKTLIDSLVNGRPVSN